VVWRGRLLHMWFRR